jgi:hypothetical protein
MSRDVLDAIDAAIDDWETSDDAVRMNAPVSLVKRPASRGLFQVGSMAPYAGMRQATFTFHVDTSQFEHAMRQLAESARRTGEALSRWYATLPQETRDRLSSTATAPKLKWPEPKDAQERWQMLLEAKRAGAVPPGVELATRRRRRN